MKDYYFQRILFCIAIAVVSLSCINCSSTKKSNTYPKQQLSNNQKYKSKNDIDIKEALLKYGWQPDQIESANTASKESSMTNPEKMVITLTNLTRMYPAQFCRVMVKMWKDAKDPFFNISNSYFISLENDLNKAKSVQRLFPDKKMINAARIHAVKMGKLGRTGHARNYEFTVAEKAKGLHNIKNFGENCDYGSIEPISIMMSLLVDKDVKSLGHRKNILDPSYNKIGVAIEPHKSYGNNCVMDFNF